MCVLKSDFVFATSLASAQTILENVVGSKGFKFGSTIVPCELFSCLDWVDGIKVVNTGIIIFYASIGLTAVIDQNSWEFHNAVFLHANLDSV